MDKSRNICFFNLVFVYVVILCLFSPSPLYSQEKKLSLSVVKFSAEGVSEMVAVSLTEVLRNYLVLSKELDVIEQAQMDKVLSQQAFQQTGCTDAECAVEIGKILNVKNIVLGSVSSIGRKYIVSLRLVNVELGKIETAVTKSSICELEELVEVVQEAGGELLQNIFGRKTEVERLGAIEVKSTPSKAKVSLDKEVSVNGVIWTRQTGTSSWDGGLGVSVDSSGNIYVTGATDGGLEGNINAGWGDIFLIKYKP